MILSDRQIVEALVKKEISIEPFTNAHLTPNGYDLSIAEIFIPKLDKRTAEGKLRLRIPSQTWFVISTKEYIKLPRHTAQLWIRTSFARHGVIPSFGKVDAGFKGTLTLSAFNAGEELVLKVGDRFAQVVFETLGELPKLLYPQRSGTFMGQRGIRLER